MCIRHRGNVIVITAIVLVVVMGLASLGIDMSMVVAERWRLQTATDNCALAVASYLTKNAGGNQWSQELQDEVDDYGTRFMKMNVVAGRQGDTGLVPRITLGWATIDPVTRRFADFAEAGSSDSYFNAVRVRAGLGGDYGGPLDAILGGIVGQDSYDISASAISMLPPRDIVFAFDESLSMNYDSSLRHVWYMHTLRGAYPNAKTNLREVWKSFSFSEPWPHPEVEPSADQGIYHPQYDDDPHMPGPRFGTFMNLPTIPDEGYGTSDEQMSDAADYAPREDAGLVYLATCTVPAPPGQDLAPWDIATLVKLGLVTEVSPGQYAASGVLVDEFGQALNYAAHIRQGLARLDPADLDADGRVGGGDRAILNDDLGPCPLPCQPGAIPDNCLADLNGDCVVDGLDDAILLSRFGDTDPVETSGQYASRVGVALGLYTWTPSGPNDATIPETPAPSSTDGWPEELSMLDTDGQRMHVEVENIYGFKWSLWFVQAGSTSIFVDNPGFDFRYCFGVKTLWHFMLTARPRYFETPQFANAPQQPILGCKNATKLFFDKLVEINNNDQVAMVAYARDALDGWFANRWIDFRSAAHYEDLLAHLNARQAGYWNGSTNTGQALEKAIDLLVDPENWNSSQPNALDPREGAQKVILLLTDGQANIDENGDMSVQGGFDYALDQAQRAALPENRVIIHTITIGADGHWVNGCPEPQEGTAVPDQWFDLNSCGLGQSVAYLTGGTAHRIEADIQNLEDMVGDALLKIAQKIEGIPGIVD